MRAIWTLLLLCVVLDSQAADPRLPPPMEEGRLRVNVGMLLLDLRDIDDVDQSFEAVLIVRLSWLDPRLRSDSNETRSFTNTEIWNPRYQVSNEVFARKRFRELLHVQADGTVVHVQRLSGRFSSRLDLQKFPFDAQALHFRLSFPDFEPEQLVVVPDQGFSGTMPDLTIVDWSLGDWSLRSEPLRALRGISRASAVFEFRAERRTGYYLWKIIFPLVLIVFMSWTVFWINPENVGAQIGVATSSMLTLIAYRFILGNLLPRVSYLTQLDYFILGATILVFAALFEAVLTSGLAESGRQTQARRIDKAARLAFPLLFGLLLVSVFVG